MWLTCQKKSYLTCVEVRNSELYFSAVSVLCCLSQFCTLKKQIGIVCVNIRKFVISTQNSFSFDMPTTLVKYSLQKKIRNIRWTFDAIKLL